jgi:hypothetical protein
MDDLDILNMLDNTSMTIFYPHDLNRFGTVFFSEEEEVVSKEDLERGCMDKNAFLEKYAHLVTSAMIGPNCYLVRYTWSKCKEEDSTLQIENVRVLVQ